MCMYMFFFSCTREVQGNGKLFIVEEVFFLGFDSSLTSLMYIYCLTQKYFVIKHIFNFQYYI